MRFVRLIGAAIIIYGLSYLRHSVTQIFFLVTERDPTMSRYILLNLNIGVVTFILGLGLILAHEWARVTWLMCAIALLALHTVILFLPGQSDLTMPILNFILILLLFLVSWLKLTRPSIKELFS